MTKNLTVGNPALLIFSFAVPLLVGNLFQQFYNMADAFIVGDTLGMDALAAVGCTGSINFLILGFMMGFTQGASIVTSQRFGGSDAPGVRRSFGASALLGAGVTAGLMAVSVTSARPLLVFLRTDPKILDAAYSYIIVIYWGLPATLVFNLCSNMMRAVGDSVTPLIFLVIACIINIALDYAFIRGFHTGVEGAAYATVIAQVIAGLLCIPVIARKLPILRLTKADWKPDRKELWEHFRVAMPMGFQMSIIAIGVVSVTFALNGLGIAAVAAFTAGQKIDMVAGMPLSSFGAAMTTFTAQNYGAQKISRIRQGVAQCCLMSCAFSVFMGVLFFLAGDKFAAVFLKEEASAVALAHTYLKITGSFYILLACLFIFRQSLQGLGDSLVPTIAGVVELAMRTFAAIILTRYFGFAGLCFASPLAFFGACVPLTIAIVLTLKRLARKSLAEKKLPNQP
ncbi:MAG: MATE family efflux transporter [Spirochaetaceae bacterium]|jgi:putative MATE family efflux protein|nr:MATE family efflux transporter [Spirochaetaceae bacterium]